MTTNNKGITKDMDNINERCGEIPLSSARLLNHLDTPNAIAPAWKSDGIRQTI